MTRLNYAAGPTIRSKRTYSELCGRWFHSKAEMARGMELALLERGGAIKELQYQVPFLLSIKPKVTITVDFSYLVPMSKPLAATNYLSGVSTWERIYEDTKGVMTREFRVKLAWLYEKHGIAVRLNG